MKKTSSIINAMKIAALYIIIIAVWQCSYYLFVDKLGWVKAYIYPTPFGIVGSLVNLIKSGMLWFALLNSFRKMLIGFSISIVLGILLGLLLTRSKFISDAFKPVILGMQTLPSICYVPFSILWFGLKDSATIFVIIVGSIFSICISTESAIRNVNPILIRAAKTMGASNVVLYSKVILPASIPEFISGLKHGWSFAWRALIAGEMVSGTIGGLGYILLVGRELLDINQVMVVIIIIILISVFIEKILFGRVESYARKRTGLI